MKAWHHTPASDGGPGEFKLRDGDGPAIVSLFSDGEGYWCAIAGDDPCDGDELAQGLDGWEAVMRRAEVALAQPGVK